MFFGCLRFQTALGQARPSRAARKVEKKQNQVKAQKNSQEQPKGPTTGSAVG
jgi:hypothetical protein